MSVVIENSLANDVVSNVTCSVCQNLFSKPKMMPSCLHTFCLDCLKKVPLEKKENFWKIKCPECQTESKLNGPEDERGVEKFKTNIVAKNVVAAIKTRGEVRAGESCPHVGDKEHCVHCARDFCRPCRLIHMEELKTEALEICKEAIDVDFIETAKDKLAQIDAFIESEVRLVDEQIAIVSDTIKSAFESALDRHLDALKTHLTTLKSDQSMILKATTHLLADGERIDELKKARDQVSESILKLQLPDVANFYLDVVERRRAASYLEDVLKLEPSTLFSFELSDEVENFMASFEGVNFGSLQLHHKAEAAKVYLERATMGIDIPEPELESSEMAIEPSVVLSPEKKSDEENLAPSEVAKKMVDEAVQMDSSEIMIVTEPGVSLSVTVEKEKEEEKKTEAVVEPSDEDGEIRLKKKKKVVDENKEPCEMAVKPPEAKRLKTAVDNEGGESNTEMLADKDDEIKLKKKKGKKADSPEARALRRRKRITSDSGDDEKPLVVSSEQGSSDGDVIMLSAEEVEDEEEEEEEEASDEEESGEEEEGEEEEEEDLIEEEVEDSDYERYSTDSSQAVEVNGELDEVVIDSVLKETKRVIVKDSNAVVALPTKNAFGVMHENKTFTLIQPGTGRIVKNYAIAFPCNMDSIDIFELATDDRDCVILTAEVGIVEKINNSNSNNNNRPAPPPPPPPPSASDENNSMSITEEKPPETSSEAPAADAAQIAEPEREPEPEKAVELEKAVEPEPEKTVEPEPEKTVVEKTTEERSLAEETTVISRCLYRFWMSDRNEVKLALFAKAKDAEDFNGLAVSKEWGYVFTTEGDSVVGFASMGIGRSQRATRVFKCYVGPDPFVHAIAQPSGTTTTADLICSAEYKIIDKVITMNDEGRLRHKKDKRWRHSEVEDLKTAWPGMMTVWEDNAVVSKGYWLKRFGGFPDNAQNFGAFAPAYSPSQPLESLRALAAMHVSTYGSMPRDYVALINESDTVTIAVLPKDGCCLSVVE